MNYYMNKMMVDKIRKTPYKRVTIPKQLHNILDEGLIFKNNCVFIRYFYNANPHLIESQFEDNTQYEHTINGFHFVDYFDKCTINHIFAFVDKLEKIIKSSDFKYPILIVISFDKDDFHFSLGGIHDNETPWIDANDLDYYKQAILLIKI